MADSAAPEELVTMPDTVLHEAESTDAVTETNESQILDPSLNASDSVTSPNPHNPLNIFHPFSRLPIEMRFKIWNFALPSARIYSIESSSSGPIVFGFDNPGPQLANVIVNKEARGEALRSYRHIPFFPTMTRQAYPRQAYPTPKPFRDESSNRNILPQTPFHVDFSVDIIYLNNGHIARLEDFTGQLLKYDWGLSIQRLAINYRVWMRSKNVLENLIEAFPALREVTIIGSDWRGKYRHNLWMPDKIEIIPLQSNDESLYLHNFGKRSISSLCMRIGEKIVDLFAEKKRNFPGLKLPALKFGAIKNIGENGKENDGDETGHGTFGSDKEQQECGIGGIHDCKYIEEYAESPMGRREKYMLEQYMRARRQQRSS